MLRLLYQNGYYYEYSNEYGLQCRLINNNLSPDEVIVAKWVHQSQCEYPSAIKPPNKLWALHTEPSFQGAEGNKIKYVTLETYGNLDQLTYFPLCLMDMPQDLLTNNAFSKINKTVLEMLKDPDVNLRLLIWFPTEGFPINHWQMHGLLNENVQTLGIPPNKVCLVHGDLKINTNWKKNYKCPKEYTLLGMNYFEFMYMLNIVNSNLGSNYPKNILEEFKKTPLSKTKKKYFMCKNGVSRIHRIYLCWLLYSKNLLDDGYVSFLNHLLDIEQQLQDNGSFDSLFKNGLNNDFRQTLKFEQFVKSFPWKLPTEELRVHTDITQWLENLDFYKDTHFTLVSETITEDNALFLSEKTYQPILHCHPFITVGSHGTLRYLRSIGYKTFPELFDESYDEISDTVKRIDAVIKNVENVVSGAKDDYLASDELKEILIHNHNHLLNRGNIEFRRIFKLLEKG